MAPSGQVCRGCLRSWPPSLSYLGNRNQIGSSTEPVGRQHERETTADRTRQALVTPAVRRKISKRTRAGIAKARKEGKQIGRAGADTAVIETNTCRQGNWVSPTGS